MQIDLYKQLKVSSQQFQVNKLQKARTRMQQLIEFYPYDVAAYINLSTIYAEQKNFQQAQAILQKAIQISPYDFKVYYSYFAIKAKQKQWQQAHLYLKKTLSNLYLLNTKPTNLDMKLLKKAKRYWSGNIAVYILIAKYLFDRQQFLQAIQEIDGGIITCDTNRHLYYVRSILFNKIGQYEKALKSLKKAKGEISALTNNSQIDERINQQKQILTQKQIKTQIKQLCKQFNQAITKIQVNKLSTLTGKNIVCIDIQQKIKIIQLDALVNQIFGSLDQDQVRKKLQNQEQKQQHKSDKEKEQQQRSKLYPLKFQKVQLQFMNAELLNNTQMMGNMDPYIIINYDSKQKHRTKTIRGGGMSPKWQKQIKVLKLQKQPTKILVEVWDHQTFKRDDLIGKGQFVLDKTGSEVVTIFFQGKNAGNIFINVTPI